MPQPSTTRGGPSAGKAISVETNGVVKTYIAEELPLGSLPRVLKERDLHSTFIACNINA